MNMARSNVGCKGRVAYSMTNEMSFYVYSKQVVLLAERLLAMGNLNMYEDTSNTSFRAGALSHSCALEFATTPSGNVPSKAE